MKLFLRRLESWAKNNNISIHILVAILALCGILNDITKRSFASSLIMFLLWAWYITKNIRILIGKSGEEEQDVIAQKDNEIHDLRKKTGGDQAYTESSKEKSSFTLN